MAGYTLSFQLPFLAFILYCHYHPYFSILVSVAFSDTAKKSIVQKKDELLIVTRNKLSLIILHK